ncbi:MAG: hypothetical protein II838_13435, partial [Lachnospiraceae bacterium]|nr:hypothetical protein [Lachnospiraceae bacterium]
GYIFLGFSPFPRRTHRVRTAGMSLSKKNLSQNSCIKRLRENIRNQRGKRVNSKAVYRGQKIFCFSKNLLIIKEKTKCR